MRRTCGGLVRGVPTAADERLFVIMPRVQRLGADVLTQCVFAEGVAELAHTVRSVVGSADREDFIELFQGNTLRLGHKHSDQDYEG
jgi:hypothetical protein